MKKDRAFSESDVSRDDQGRFAAKSGTSRAAKQAEKYKQMTKQAAQKSGKKSAAKPSRRSTGVDLAGGSVRAQKHMEKSREMSRIASGIYERPKRGVYNDDNLTPEEKGLIEAAFGKPRKKKAAKSGSAF